MLISESMNKAINEQIGREFGADLQYIAIASYFGSESLPQLAAHFNRQADEEGEHAKRFVKYLVDAGGRVAIPAIPEPRNTFETAEEAVQLSLAWEQNVTKQINTLVDQAIKENDHLTRHFLQWYVNEQLEEVSSMELLLRTVQRAGETGLLMVEDYLARQGGSASSGEADAS
jgi:bacterioferritin B